jgi:hypothetical protein
VKPYSLRALFVGRGWRDTAVMVGAWGLAVAGIWRAAHKGTGWPSAIGVALMALLYTFIPWLEPLRHRNEAARLERLYGTVTIDDWGVTRVRGRLREAVAWRDLVWVCIQTTDEGPGAEDFFFLLGSADGKGCVVPNFIATKLGLLGTLQERLPGLDNAQVTIAAGSTTNAFFTIWGRQSPTSAD